MDSTVWVIVPAHNEAHQLPAVLADLRSHGWEHVVVVDDGSTDGTGAVASSAGVSVLWHLINRGQGAALETGTQYARGNGAAAVVHFDGDGQFVAGDIAPALAEMNRQSADLLLGSRFLDSRSPVPWLKRHVILPISRSINFLFTGVRLTDAHNGFRILGARALEHIHLTHDRMAHASEIIRQMKQYNLRWVEYPVLVRYREFGQGVGGGFSIIWQIIVGYFI